MTLLVASLMPTQAQTILEEDFETGTTKSAKTPLTHGDGWTTINSYTGENMLYNWFNYYADPESQAGPTLSGANCAACDAPVNVNPVDGSGPREEILLSPEELNIIWKLRRVLHALDTQQALELVLSKLKKTKSNAEFLLQVQKTTIGPND